MPCHLRSSLPPCTLIPVPARTILSSCLYPQPSPLVLLYTSLSVSFAPATTSLPVSSYPLTDFSTYDPLYLPASFTREDLLVRLLPLLPLSPPPSPPPLLQGIAPVTLLWTKARSWHSLDAARSSGKVALGAYNVRCKTD